MLLQKRSIVTPTSIRTLKKSNWRSKFKDNFFKIVSYQFFSLIKLSENSKCKANSIYFLINTIQSNKDVYSTSSKNSLSDANKFQSIAISLYNVDSKDKFLPLPLSTTSKVFQCKETGVHVSKDNGRNSCEKKKYSVALIKPLLDMPSNFFIELILNSKRDVSTYKKLSSKPLLMQRSMK